MKAYLSTAEVADLLGYHTKTVELWCREGRVRSIRPFEGSYRIPMAELRRLESPTPPTPTHEIDNANDWEATKRKVFKR